MAAPEGNPFLRGDPAGGRRDAPAGNYHGPAHGGASPSWRSPSGAFNPPAVSRLPSSATRDRPGPVFVQPRACSSNSANRSLKSRFTAVFAVPGKAQQREGPDGLDPLLRRGALPVRFLRDRRPLAEHAGRDISAMAAVHSCPNPCRGFRSRRAPRGTCCRELRTARGMGRRSHEHPVHQGADDGLVSGFYPGWPPGEAVCGRFGRGGDGPTTTAGSYRPRSRSRATRRKAATATRIRGVCTTAKAAAAVGFSIMRR